MDFNRENERKAERVVLTIYTIYTIGMAVMTFWLSWGGWVIRAILTGLAFSWAVYIKKFRDYQFRALFMACMSWMNFIIYGINSDSFFGILSTMICMIILLGIYCIPKIVYVAVAASTFLLFYHSFVSGNIHIMADGEGARLLLQILSVYVAQYVTYYMVREQMEGNRKLLRVIADLQKAERSQDDFMANVSHEIRTPINTVCGMSEMILREELPPRVREDVFGIQTAGRILLSVVSDILDFSELESGKLTLVEEPYNITSTMNDIMNMALARMEGKKLELIVDCEATMPCGMVGDEQKIRRAIMNIMDNAVKFTKEGAVILVISARKEEYGVNLSVTVRDTGIGMDEKNVDKLFNSFSQVDTKRNRQEGGIGLGLAITQALVSKMGGFITVKSVPDRGSEIQLVIPQKVVDKTPIISLKSPEKIRAVYYINMEKYDFAAIRDGYAGLIRRIAEQLKISCRQCKNLQELKRHLEKEKYSHVFISWEEYCEDKEYFEALSNELKVVLVKEREREEAAGSRIFPIYKPFSVLSIAAVFNGEHVVQSMEGGSHRNGRFIAPQASVLVVDDNIMNLRVVEGLLRPYKIKVFAAGSGKEALSKIETMDFDFVFMDHMMPEMDGVETLHRIRQKPGRYFQEVPVIALTANAIGGAREMFIAEGFADFVAKPIELSVLERVLRRYIPESKIVKIEEAQEELEEVGQIMDGVGKNEEIGKTAVTQGDTARKGAKRLDGLDMDGIDADMGIAYCGGVLQDYIDIVKIYYTGGLTKKKEIQQNYEKKDWKNYTIGVHSLKSMSMGIGAVRLSNMAKELEAAGKAKNEGYILAHTWETLTEYGRVLDAIGENKVIFPEGTSETGWESNAGTGENAGKGNGTESAAVTGDGRKAEDYDLPELTQEKLEEALDKLAKQLETFESEGVQAVFAQMEAYQYRGQLLSEYLASVREKAEAFDFMGAEEELAARKRTLLEKMR